MRIKFDGVSFDCGDKLGFLAANVAFALEREDLRAAFRTVLQNIIAKHKGYLSWDGNSELTKVLKEIRAGAEGDVPKGGTGPVKTPA